MQKLQTDHENLRQQYDSSSARFYAFLCTLPADCVKASPRQPPIVGTSIHKAYVSPFGQGDITCLDSSENWLLACCQSSIVNSNDSMRPIPMTANDRFTPYSRRRQSRGILASDDCSLANAVVAVRNTSKIQCRKQTRQRRKMCHDAVKTIPCHHLVKQRVIEELCTSET